MIFDYSVIGNGKIITKIGVHVSLDIIKTALFVRGLILGERFQ